MENRQTDIKKLVGYVNESVDTEEDFHFLRFEALQRLNIVNLEVDLARMKSQFMSQQCGSARELEDLRLKLEQYAVAIRDYQDLQDKRSLLPWEMRERKLRLHKYFYSAAEMDDPWASHYSYFQNDHRHSVAIPADYVREALMRHLPSRLSFSHDERLARSKEYEEGKPPRIVSKFVDRLARFAAAFTGGTFLVVPMIIMTLRPSETKSLVTVSVAVIIFALLLSFGVKVSNVETLVSTATYAAVLVVFVGTSSGSSTGSDNGSI
ncbi:hypothetical protein Daus18300_009512 [Diaporthe australafricana]|uniref:DUF6594 domain-containing protein n=1 Tax=Diaporthe australafricana TaxID=127596 RepID=A0ABR3WEF1_9PEZI